MHNHHLIPFPNAKDWLALATIYAGSPAKLRLTLICAGEEIALLQREIIRLGGTPPVGTLPARVLKKNTPPATKEGGYVRFIRPSDDAPVR